MLAYESNTYQRSQIHNRIVCSMTNKNYVSTMNEKNNEYPLSSSSKLSNFISLQPKYKYQESPIAHESDKWHEDQNLCNKHRLSAKR